MTESNHGFKIYVGDLWLLFRALSEDTEELLSICMSYLCSKNINLLSGIIFVNITSNLLYGFNAA